MASNRQQQPAGRRKGTDTGSAGGVDVADYKSRTLAHGRRAAGQHGRGGVQARGSGVDSF